MGLVGSSGIDGFFHPLFPSSGPWVRMERTFLADLGSVAELLREVREEELPPWTAAAVGPQD